METGQKRVLLTGALGGVGFAVAEKLSAAGMKILGLDNFSPFSADEPHFLAIRERFALLPHAAFNAVDLRDSGALREAIIAFRPEIVVHCAASVPPGIPASETQDIAGDALIMAENLAAVMRETSIARLVVPVRAAGDSENESGSPANSEPAAKTEPRSAALLSEKLSEIEVIILPFPELFGPGQAYRSFPFLQLRQLVSRVPVELSSRKQVRMMRLSHAAELIRHAALLGETDAVGQGKTLYVNPMQVLKLLAQLTGIEAVPEKSMATATLTSDDSAGWEERNKEDPDSIIHDTVAGLVRWALALPYMPPLDWPSKKRRKKYRGSRKRAKNSG